MLHFDSSTLPLPVHIGDDLYYVDTAAGNAVKKMDHAVTGILLTGNQLLVMTTEDEEQPMELGKDYFLRYNEAKAWADANMPQKPYPYGRDALSWMPANTWLPMFSGWKFVKIPKGDIIFVCECYYFNGIPDGRYADYPQLGDSTAIRNGTPAAPGFYEDQSPGAKKLDGIAAWIDNVMGIDEAMEAYDFAGVSICSDHRRYRKQQRRPVIRSPVRQTEKINSLFLVLKFFSFLGSLVLIRTT